MIDTQLRGLIEYCMREGRVRRSDAAVRETIEHLIRRGEVVRGPYGGLVFPVATD